VERIARNEFQAKLERKRILFAHSGFRIYNSVLSLTRVHHRFSIAEFERMIQTGILTEDDRVELIRGEIVTKMTVGKEHAAGVNRLTACFSQYVGKLLVLSIQNPVQLPDSEPEPDVMLLKPRDDYYAARLPQPVVILLLIEVADSSLEYDREVKSGLYAENGIGEYWIVNLLEKSLEVYRQPRPAGGYAELCIYRPCESVQLTALPGVVVEVGKIVTD